METGSPLRAAARRQRGLEVAGLIVLAVLIALIVALLLHRANAQSVAPAVAVTQRPALDGQATWAAGARPAPAISTLRDQNGRRFTLASLHGRPVVVTFWDSHCTQECPLAGRALAAAERTVPRVARPVLVVVSVNPKDTPASVRSAIHRWGLAGLESWHWLMGSHAQLAPVWRAYRIEVIPTKTDIVHTEALYLLDRRGDERSAYLYPYLPARVASDLRKLATGAVGSGRV
jgi:protein SCO1/2